MKALIVSYLSKLLSNIALPLSGAGIYLSGKGVVDLSDAASVDAAGASIATGLMVIASAIISRLLGKWLTGKTLSAGTSQSGGTSGMTLLLACATAAGLGVLSLPSCATTVTQTTLPDGTVITVTAKASDADAISAAVAMSELILPIIIHPDK